jgi:hypothetical protein
MNSIDETISSIIKEAIDLIVGGKSDGMSLGDIAKKHKVPLSQLEVQIKKGIKVEREHTNTDKVAREIAKDHLFEFPDYYDRLEKMEKKAEKDFKK